jgi:hypothetical protein
MDHFGNRIQYKYLFSSSDLTKYSGNFQTNFVNLKTGFGYERQINNFFLFGAKAGMQNGMNTRHQKLYSSPNDLIAEVQRRTSPYLNISIAVVPVKLKKK